MRFAMKTSPQNTTWTGMLEIFRAADEIDVFESGWTFDHFYPIFSDSTGPCLEGWTTLADSDPAGGLRHARLTLGGTGGRRGYQAPRFNLFRKATSANVMLTSPMPARAAKPSASSPACHPVSINDRSAASK